MNHWYLEPARTVDETMRVAALDRQLKLTKPPGSLGRMEELAVTLSSHQNRIDPQLDAVEIAIFAGDHGVAEEGVSAFPQVVTGEMVKNFIRGGAAISVIANQLGANLTVINAGTIFDQGFDQPVIDRPIALGTRNFVNQAAMSRIQCDEALGLGRDIAKQFDTQTELVIGGEMGIANTSSATALSASLGVGSAAELVGPGTGLQASGVNLKLAVIEKALTRVVADHGEPTVKTLLCELGGFEIAALTGFYTAAAQRGMTILVDGFISSVAALIACKMNPSVHQWMMFAHSSAEPGHKLVLQSLDATPILDLSMRLGEGSGAAVAVNLLRSACALQNQMATFAEAGVSDSDL